MPCWLSVGPCIFREGGREDPKLPRATIWTRRMCKGVPDGKEEAPPASQKRLKADYTTGALGTVGVPRRDVGAKRFNYDKTLHGRLGIQEDEDEGILESLISHAS